MTDTTAEEIIKRHSIYGSCDNHIEHFKNYLNNNHRINHEMWGLAFRTFLFKVE